MTADNRDFLLALVRVVEAWHFVQLIGVRRMQQIEYKLMRFKTTLRVRYSREQHDQNLTAFIQEQGDKGWDLKAVVPSGVCQLLIIFGRTATES